MSEAPAETAPVTEAAAPEAPAAGGSLLKAAPAEGETIVTADGEWLLTPEIKGVGDRPDWMPEKFKTMQDMAVSYNELEKKFGSFSGAPDEYALNGPEGFEFDEKDPLIAGARDMAKEIGMNQEGFDKMIDLWIANTAQDEEQTQLEMNQQLVQVLGDNHAQKISQISGALSNMLDAETLKEVAPYANTPGAIRLVEAVILATAPKVAPINNVTNPEGITMAKLTEMRNVRITEGPHKGELKWHKDPDFREQVLAYSEALHGE